MRRNLSVVAIAAALVVMSGLLVGATIITNNGRVRGELEASLQQRAGAELGVLVGPLTFVARRGSTITATSGVMVLRVLPGSAAERAGLQPGDVISRIEGEPVTAPAAVRLAIDGHEPGTVLAVTVQSGSQAPRTIGITLAEPQDSLAVLPQRAPRLPAFGFGQPARGSTVVSGTVGAVSGVSITIQVEATGETLTFSVDNRTRVLAGPGRTSPLDLRPGDAVLIKSTEGELRARIVASPDAMRRNMPNLGPRVIPSPFASHPKP